MSPSSSLRFDGRVAIVTGAGNGLGRAHALLLASRGCKVVVNDLGGSAQGAGKSSTAADAVVAEIKAAGGEAVANYDSVEDGDKIVQTALDTWKRIDIVINNAGILRDTSFQKMTDGDWDLVQRVHLAGAYKVTHAAWNHMRDAGYGRILFTASAAGIYGNFGQANYAAMKLALVGMSNTLAIEGGKKNVLSNVIAPIAGSRLTETILPKEITEALKPELVSPLAAYLCHEGSTENGGLFEVGGGFFGKLRWERSEGKVFKLGRAISPEQVRDQWKVISGFEKATHPANITESMAPILGNLGTQSHGANELIDADEALGYTFEPVTSSYDERDVALYALGIGAAANPLDPSELKYVVAENADGFQVLPTFAVVPALREMFKLYMEGKTAPGLHYGFERVLHAEQYTELRRPLPTHGKQTHHIKIKDIFDKGKHALVVTEIRTTDEDGEELMRNEVTAFVRGAGGFGGPRGPSADSVTKEPDRAPDAVITESTSPTQALLYRLSGDNNPLHVDPAFAQGFGFEKPILHGLCTFGYAARHVIKTFAKNDARLFKSIRVRFTDSVFPGETIVTEMWKESDTKIVFRCKVKERDKVVLAAASIELYTEIPKRKAPAAQVAAPAPAATSAASAEPQLDGMTSRDIFWSIRHHIETNPDMVKQIGAVFQFNLTEPALAFTVDLKTSGAVTEGAAQGADCTLEMSQSDFLGMATGKLNAQKLYFGKQLKITGNVMASQKLEFLKNIDPKKTAAAMKAAGYVPGGGGGAGASGTAAADAPKPAEAKPAAPRESKAKTIVAALTAKFGKAPPPKADAVIAFDVREPEATFTVDLAKGTVSTEASAAATSTVRLTDDDLAALVAGADLRSLYQHGNIRIDGDMRAVSASGLGFLKGLV